MKKYKILLVSSAFHPELSPRSFRATELAKEFCREGHDVTVITKNRGYDYSSFFKKYPVNLKMWENSSFMKVPKVNIQQIDFFIKGLYRILSLMFEFPAIIEMFKVKQMLRNEKSYDLMISFAVPYPVHWGVAGSLNGKNNIAKKWVADCGDPYMFARLDTFKKPFYFKYPEIDFCKKCDYITIPFRELQEQFYPQFKPKMRVIPQGFNFDEIKLADNYKKNSVPHFIFAGSVIPGLRDLDQFLTFLCSLSVDFRFIVYTRQEEYYKKYKDILGAKLELRGFVDRHTLIYEMSKMDFLVNVDTVHDTNNNVEAIPSKLIDYALSGKPILNINSANLDENNVLRFLNGDYSGRRMVNKSNFDIKIVAAKFLNLIN